MAASLARALVVTLLLACGIRPSAGPVPVEAPAGDRSALVGRWEGTYRVSGIGRRGNLRFELQPGADTAYGEVEMTFSVALRLYGDTRDADLARHPCTVIGITVVRLADSLVRGTLAPYWDPDCDCRTHTVFEGTIENGRVAGTFTSGPGGSEPPRLTGTWFAERRPGPPPPAVSGAASPRE